MRKAIDLQMEFWGKDIADIEFDLDSRDEIPKLLMGLQHIYRTPQIREKVFEVLKQIVPRKNHETGRPGTDPLWGAPRIHGGLLKLGIDYISERTASNIIKKCRPPKPPSQTWRTFLKNHMHNTFAMDFFTVPTATFTV